MNPTPPVPVQEVGASLPTRSRGGAWWRRRVLAPLHRQLTQGVSPHRLAAALAVGAVIAVNPFLGTTTLGCVLAGVLLRLNQPTLQVANLLATPLQLALILPWVRAGEWLWQAPAVPLNPAQIVADFSAAPGEFLARFGRTGVHAASAWIFAAPLIAGAVFLLARPLFTRWANARSATPAVSP